MPKRKIGAPPKRDPRPGERFTIATRVRPEIKRRLDDAAEMSGRSQAQETELRLEHSFDREDLLGEVLTLAFGECLAGLLILLGLAMAGAAAVAPPEQGRHILRGEDNWMSDPHGYAAAEFAASTLLELGRPEMRGVGKAYAFTSLGFDVVEALVDTLNGAENDAVLGRGAHVAAIRRMIGPMAARMNLALSKEKEVRQRMLRTMKKDVKGKQKEAS